MSGKYNFLDLAEKRFSVRKFIDKPVEKADLDKIIKAGCVAPTGCNLQPQRVMVITSSEGMEKLRKCTKCHFGAPNAIVVCYNKNECWTRKYDGKTSGEDDAAIVTTHMMLEAADLGVGTTWVMHFDPAALKNEFEIPDELEPVAILVMGYPAEDAEINPMHSQFRPLEEIVSYR